MRRRFCAACPILRTISTSSPRHISSTETSKRTVAVDSGNLEALVGLGNALYEQEPSAALQYLEKAQEIHPTPYLTSRIASLRGK